MIFILVSGFTMCTQTVSREYLVTSSKCLIHPSPLVWKGMGLFFLSLSLFLSIYLSVSFYPSISLDKLLDSPLFFGLERYWTILSLSLSLFLYPSLYIPLSLYLSSSLSFSISLSLLSLSLSVKANTSHYRFTYIQGLLVRYYEIISSYPISDIYHHKSFFLSI